MLLICLHAIWAVESSRSSRRWRPSCRTCFPPGMSTRRRQGIGCISEATLSLPSASPGISGGESQDGCLKTAAIIHCNSEARYTSRIEPPQQEKDSSASSWLPPPKLIATFPIRGFCYLVECDSEILVAVSISTRPSQFSELGTKGKSLVRVRGRLVGVSRESFDLASVLPATPFLSSNVFILLLALLLQVSNSISSLILGYRFKSVG